MPRASWPVPTYRRWIEDRPYRRALVPARAADRLEADARLAGSTTTQAVIEAAGLRRAVRRSRPADLTERQVEVLRLVSRLSNAEIADRLVLSRRTVEHHVQDIYLKIGVSTRAGAAMFAMLGSPAHARLVAARSNCWGDALDRSRTTH